MSLARTRVTSGTDGARKTPSYQPDRLVQDALWDVNANLRLLERERAEELGNQAVPPILLIGYAPRSGSTLLSQLLARSGCWNYVSNFQARFWLAPYHGALLERSIAPRDISDIPLNSNYGLTPSSSSPSEFSYFWEHWLNLSSADRPHQPHALDHDQWQAVDHAALRRQFTLLGSLGTAPWFFKKDWLLLNAQQLLTEFPTAKFLHIRRNVLDVACSIWQARCTVLGSPDNWWAARPERIEELAKLSWPDQIAGQIAELRFAASQLEDRFPGRVLTVDYETLTLNVHRTIRQVNDFIGAGCEELDTLPDQLPCRSTQNERPCRDELALALRRAGLITTKEFQA